MARNITVPAGVPDLSSPSLRLVDSSDVIQDTITLNQATNALGRYTGVIAGPTPAGDYTALLRSGTSVIGVYERVTLVGDPEDVIVRDTVVEGSLADITADPSGVPPDSTDFYTRIRFLYAALKNLVTVSNSKKIFHDPSNVAQWEKDVSDDGTTYSETKANSP